MAQENGLFKTEYGTSLNAGLPTAANPRDFQWILARASGLHNAGFCDPGRLFRCWRLVSAGGRDDSPHFAMDAESDEALMARIGRGEQAAFRVLARRYAAICAALAARVLGNRAEADDVAQEALLRVWTNAPRWQPVAKFRTWLTRIVINLCLDRKRRAPWVALEAAGELADPARDPAAQYESNERERRLADAIGQLPIRQRAAIVLVYREGMSHAEAAEILGSSVSAVETLLARGKTALRRALKDDGE